MSNTMTNDFIMGLMDVVEDKKNVPSNAKHYACTHNDEKKPITRESRIEGMMRNGYSDEEIAIEPWKAFCGKSLLIDPFIDESGNNMVSMKKCIISESLAGVCTVITDDGHEEMKNAAIVGTEDFALGIFIPFSASQETIKWAANFYGGMVNKKDIKKIDIVDF